MKLYLRVLAFIKPHTAVLGIAVVFMIFSALFDSVQLTVLVPLIDIVLGQNKILFNKELPPVVAGLVDKMNNTSPETMLIMIAVIIPIAFILKGLFFFGRTYMLTKLSQLAIRDIRNKLYEKIQYFSLDYFTKSATGHLVSRITYDVEVIKGAISVGLTDIFYQTFMLVFLSGIVLSINWKWALMSIGVLPLVIYPIFRIGRMIKKVSTQAQEKMADLNRKLFETISGVRIVKAFSMEDSEIGKVSKQNNSFYEIMMRLQKRALVLGPMTECIGACGAALVLYYGGREVINKNMSFGIFSLFLGALLSIIRPCRRLSEVHSINQQALAAAKRIFNVLDAPIKVIEKEVPAELPLIKNKIEFKNVGFGYNEELVLKDIELTVKKGEVVALVGPSGVGKTSLVNLVPRFYDPSHGKVMIDGVDLKDVSFKSLRKQIGIVTQDLVLFNTTVKANIAYGRENATDEEIMQAAKTAEAHGFIENLSEGYDTIIGDMGMKLSGGQKQRLAIARAIINNPPILILDEATSQLDAESTRLVQEALDNLLINRTGFIIAHRLTTVKKVSRIIVLDEGRVVEEGSHEELLANKGLYKRLFDLEFLS